MPARARDEVFAIVAVLMALSPVLEAKAVGAGLGLLLMGVVLSLVGAHLWGAKRKALEGLRCHYLTDSDTGAIDQAVSLALATELATRFRWGDPSRAGLTALVDATAIALESREAKALDRVSVRLSNLTAKRRRRSRIAQALVSRADMTPGPQAFALANAARRVWMLDARGSQNGPRTEPHGDASARWLPSRHSTSATR